jgi:hypothetical protein
LLGNDYYTPTDETLKSLLVPSKEEQEEEGASPSKSHHRPTAKWSSTHALIRFLQQQHDAAYQVPKTAMTTPEESHAMDFVRASYHLEPLDAFDEFYDTTTKNDTSMVDEGGDVIIVAPEAAVAGLRPKTPEDMVLELAMWDPVKDATFKDGVVRCLEDYAKKLVSTNATTPSEEYTSIATINLTTQYVEVFKQMPLGPSLLPLEDQLQMRLNFIASLTTSAQSWRPRWSDTGVAYLMEKVIAHVYLEQMKYPQALIHSPADLFDVVLFHGRLHQARMSVIARVSAPAPVVAPATTLKPPPPSATVSAQLPKSTTQPPMLAPTATIRSKKSKKGKQKGEVAAATNTNNNSTATNGSNNVNNNHPSTSIATNGNNHVNVKNNNNNPSTEINRAVPAPPPVKKERQVLPVDEHEGRILKSVQENRVTIIQGETGCGKSVRICVLHYSVVHGC